MPRRELAAGVESDCWEEADPDTSHQHFQASPGSDVPSGVSARPLLRSSRPPMPMDLLSEGLTWIGAHDGPGRAGVDEHAVRGASPNHAGVLVARDVRADLGLPRALGGLVHGRRSLIMGGEDRERDS
eukprot:5314736-Pyramimonas_sp.AAC.1